MDNRRKYVKQIRKGKSKDEEVNEQGRSKDGKKVPRPQVG